MRSNGHLPSRTTPLQSSGGAHNNDEHFRRPNRDQAIAHGVMRDTWERKSKVTECGSSYLAGPVIPRWARRCTASNSPSEAVQFDGVVRELAPTNRPVLRRQVRRRRRRRPHRRRHPVCSCWQEHRKRLVEPQQGRNARNHRPHSNLREGAIPGQVFHSPSGVRNASKPGAEGSALRATPAMSSADGGATFSNVQRTSLSVRTLMPRSVGRAENTSALSRLRGSFIAELGGNLRCVICHVSGRVVPCCKPWRCSRNPITVQPETTTCASTTHPSEPCACGRKQWPFHPWAHFAYNAYCAA